MHLLEQFGRDVRFGVRGLARTPAFTLVAVLSLALGIMATTAIYSVLHAVVIDPFPYRDVDRLMSVRVSSPTVGGGRIGYSVDQFLEIAERSTIFEGVIASTISDVLWTGEGDPRRLRGNHGTFNTFAVMGVPPLLGRTPTPADARAGAEPVVVLGYRFWQREFGGAADVVGRRLTLNDTVRTVIGVMPKRFMWRGADVYLPLAFQRGEVIENVRGVHLLGRVKPGVNAAMAEADLAPIIADLKKREPGQFPDQWRVALLPFTETFPSAITREIWVLLGAVMLLLLIACANVSNLLLSRAGARRREITVRSALGASRRRIVGQLLTESLLLALIAGAVGTGLAYAGLPALLALVPPGTIPDESEIRLNVPVLLFTLAVCLAASLVCGLAPALHSARRDFATAIREAGRGLAGGSGHARLRRSIVVLEVALSLMLLAGSSVLLRAFVSMRNTHLPVPPGEVLTLRVPLPPQRYPDPARRAAFFEDLLGRVAALPRVAAVGLNSGLHPVGNPVSPVVISGQPPVPDVVQVNNVSAGYTAVLGIRLASGRLLTDRDIAATRRVALVNEQFVRARLGGREPVGQMVTISRLKDPPLSIADASFQIVGVVHDVRNDGLREPTVPEVYVPHSVAGISNRLVVRTAGDPSPAVRSIVSQVYAIDPGQPVTDVMTLQAILERQELATPRFNVVLLSIFGAVGLILAAVGVYGVMSSSVAQERQEIGVRMALGADAGAIARMVVGRGLRLLALGTAVGLGGSYAAGRWLAGEVWNVRAFDPLAFGAVSLILLLAGLQACLWPARRAAHTDPLVALRQEP